MLTGRFTYGLGQVDGSSVFSAFMNTPPSGAASGMNLPMNFNFVGGFFQFYWPYLVGGGLLLLLLARRK